MTSSVLNSIVNDLKTRNFRKLKIFKGISKSFFQFQADEPRLLVDFVNIEGTKMSDNMSDFVSFELKWLSIEYVVALIFSNS